MRQAKMNSKKFIAVFTAFCMLLTFMPLGVSAAETDATETVTDAPVFKDVSNHWGQAAIEKWSGYGIINGYNGQFRPDDSITRGEMAVILDNLMDYQVAAENKFSDLKAGQFYTEAILKANSAGIIKGDGATVRPLDKITREESAVMLSRAFAVAESGSIMSFSDASAVAGWATGAVSGMEAKGYVSGYAGKFDPKANITRAAAVTMINNIVKAYYTKAGTYTENVDGTAIIKVSDVVLKGATISGNLIIAEGVGKGDATLDSVIVKGETVVRGGGENSIHITGNSNISSIRIEKVGDKLRIVVADGITIQVVEVAVGEEIILTGNVGTLEVNASDAVVYATAAEITNATIAGDNATIIVGAKSTFNSITVSSTADNATIKTETGSVVKTVEASAPVDVSGTGTVSTVTLKSGADGSSVTTPKTVVPVATGVTGVSGTGGTAIPAGSSGTNGTSATAPATVGGSTPPASSGGGGGGGSSTVAVSAITVTGAGDATTVVNGRTLQMSAVVTPDNATNKTITWSVKNGTGTATIDASTGLLTATGIGTVKVKATNLASGVLGELTITVLDPSTAIVKTGELVNGEVSFTWMSANGIGSQNATSPSATGYVYYTDGAYLRFQIKQGNIVKKFVEVFETGTATNDTIGGMTLQTNEGPLNDMDGSNRERADWGVEGFEAYKTNLPNNGDYLFYGLIQNASEGTKTVGFEAGASRTINMKVTPKAALAAGEYTLFIETLQQGSDVVKGSIAYTFTINADQLAPTELVGISPTSIMNNDGKITGVTNAMEYRLKGEAKFVPVTGIEIVNLANGVYEVRYAAKPGFNAGATIEVTINPYVAKAIATLKNLSFSYNDASGVAVKLDVNKFVPTTTSYAVTIYDPFMDGDTHISMSPLVTDSSNAVITENSGVTFSNDSGTAIVIVTAEDGTTTNEYRVSFNVERRTIWVSNFDTVIHENAGSGASICLVGVDATGKYLANEDSPGALKLGELTVSYDGVELEDANYEVINNTIVLSDMYLNGLGVGKHVVDVKITTDDEYVMTSEYFLYIVPKTAKVIFEWPLEVYTYSWNGETNELGNPIESEDNIPIVNAGIVIDSESIPEGSVVKTLTIIEVYYDMTMEYDLTKEFKGEGVVIWVPYGTATIVLELEQ